MLEDESHVKEEIVEIFRRKVKGQRPMRQAGDHDGAQGQWLETLFGLKANGNNAPDFKGFELKNDTRAKTTFGDWQASWYIFNRRTGHCSRSEFFQIFGAPNPEKNNRYSWSGKPSPKVGFWNDFGQILIVRDDHSVDALYSFSRDKRHNKDTVVPEKFQAEELLIGRWEQERLKTLVERKFNKSGWFKCLKDDSGAYAELVFGPPMTFETFIEQVKLGKIYLDSGMYEGNFRPYQPWRADNSFWNGLIVERYS